MVLSLLAGMGLVSAADVVPASSPDLHVFTNQDGRTIKAEISSVAQDDVNLKREDGQSFKVAVTTLSKDDQSFIRQWVIKLAQAHNDDVLKLSAMTVRTDAKPGVSADKIRFTSTWSESYKIKVTNQTQAHWTALHLRYIIFRQAGVPGGIPPADYTPTHATGIVALDDLPGLQNKTVATDKIDLLEVSLSPGSTYANGAPTKVADKLQGIWVRVYDDSNNVLQEWASSKEVMKDNNWDAMWPPPSAARGRRGAGNNRGGGAGPTRGN
jgi:hypothetical protein